VEPAETTTSPQENPPYREHQGPHRQYIRDIVLGVNDGLVSTLLLVAGVVGGGLDGDSVLIAALAAALAGAVSMATGEYIATKSQEEVFEGEMELEREHFKFHRDRELDELREWFGDMGLAPEDVERVVVALDDDDESLMRVMMALEFGVVESERRNPVLAMLSSGALFLVGALPSIVPFLFLDDTGLALAWAFALAGTGLFIVGAVKTLATRGNWFVKGAENLAIAAVGGAVAYWVGSAIESWLS
jgi:VIT1/CCC1 family predicted Fe2+/Mn2+ transporter